MIETTVAHPAPESTTEPQPAYVLRGLGLFELHQGEILAGYQGAGRWLIPSGTVSGRRYEVRAGVRSNRDKCECRGFASHNHCSHVTAARRAARLSAVCDSCGQRVWRRSLIEVTEDHASLTWFPGDRVCRSCARGTDIV